MIYGVTVEFKNGSTEFLAVLAQSIREAEGVAADHFGGMRDLKNASAGSLEALIAEQYDGVATLSTGGV